MHTITTSTLACACALVLGGPVLAQSCPADVSDVAPQIEEPQLQARLGQPLDEIVAEAGGLEPAIARWEQELADAQAQKAQLTQSPPPVIRALDELILILDGQLQGLRCRRR